MIASVLRSKKAIQINIKIVEAFITFKESIINDKELNDQVKKIERLFNKQFDDVFEAINYLLKKDNQAKLQQERKSIGYKKDGERIRGV